MRKSFSISQKIQAGLALALVFLLVFATNRIDKRHFTTIQNTVNSIFNDRVVAQDYIYKLNNLFHEKQLYLNTNDSLQGYKDQHDNINNLLLIFSKTKLTPKESNHFKNLQKNVSHLQSIEKIVIANSIVVSKVQLLKLNKALQNIKIDLNHLAKTQHDESKVLTALARNSLNTNNMLSNLEIVFLIIIGVLIQIVIFYPNKSRMS